MSCCLNQLSGDGYLGSLRQGVELQLERVQALVMRLQGLALLCHMYTVTRLVDFQVEDVELCSPM